MNGVDSLAALFESLTLFDGDFSKKATQKREVSGF
jgi:hypothetical protein